MKLRKNSQITLHYLVGQSASSFLTECEFKVGSEKRCVPKDEIAVNLKCMEYVCKITKKKEYKAQMKRKRRDKAAIGLYNTSYFFIYCTCLNCSLNLYYILLVLKGFNMLIISD